MGRRRAPAWNIEFVINNAGVPEGGSVVEIPTLNIRREFEVNVTRPLLLTQGIAKQMVKRGRGTDRVDLFANRSESRPFTGLLAPSKHAVKAIAEAMGQALHPFGIGVATVNPEPFLTGFTDCGPAPDFVRSARPQNSHEPGAGVPVVRHFETAHNLFAY